MTAPSFDSARAVQFDLSHGTVRAPAGGDRVILVPASALEQLVKTAPRGVVEAFAASLGSAVGRRAAARLGDVAGASIDDVVTQMGGEAALAGVGVLSVERWGYALVVVLGGWPLPAFAASPFVSELVGAATGRTVASTLLAHDEHDARVLVAGERGVARVRGWMEGGVTWGDALAKLHRGAA